jgi:hypothetical protein
MRRFNEFKWSVATTLARWSGNRFYRPIKALLGALLVVGAVATTYLYAKTVGMLQCWWVCY